MKTYKQIHFSQISEILMQAALGVSAVCGFKYITSDMVYSLNHLNNNMHSYKEPFFIAIREQGTESGRKEECIERCRLLGYPLIIAKIEKDKVCDYNMTIAFTHNKANGTFEEMEQEFNSL